MKNDLRLTLVQTDLVWEDPEANRSNIERLLQECQPSDVVLLPEMFPTGFSMNPEPLAEDMNGPTARWMKGMAKQLDSALAGSVIIREAEKFYNRLIWAEPDGTIRHYDKRHRFSFAGEDAKYTAGTERPTWTWRGCRIRPQVCYDLRFPVWSRNDDDYDFLFYVACWPERRSHPWKSLLVSRAIENMAFVAGLNRVGKDGNGVTHSGDSAVLNALGEVIASAKPNKTEILHVVLSADELRQARERFRFLQDRDSFEISR